MWPSQLFFTFYSNFLCMYVKCAWYDAPSGITNDGAKPPATSIVVLRLSSTIGACLLCVLCVPADGGGGSGRAAAVGTAKGERRHDHGYQMCADAHVMEWPRRGRVGGAGWVGVGRTRT